MTEGLMAPSCPTCGSTMVRRQRRRDGAPFWGCGRFPQCRGIRNIVSDTSGGLQLPGAARAPRHYGRRARPDPVRAELNNAGLRLVFVLTLLVVFLIAWGPISAFLTSYFTHAILDPLATPSLRH